MGTRGSDQEREQAARPIVRPRFSIDPSRHEVRVEGRSIELTASEFRLLHTLSADPGRVFTRDQLLDSALGRAGSVTPRAIDAHIRCIRKKLGPNRGLIETVRGVGYRFPDRSGDPATVREGSLQHCFLSPALPGGAYLLARGEPCLIGRNEDNDLVLEHTKVSRLHARVLWREDGFVIYDESRNGTLVNQTQIDGKRLLEDKDVVQIGPFSLRYRESSELEELLDETETDG